MGGEQIEHGVPVPGFGERDALRRLSASAPPVGTGGEAGALPGGGEDVGPGADGDQTALRTGLHDGDVQQGGEPGVGRGESDGQRSVPGGEVCRVRQPRAVPLRGLRPPEDGGGIRRRQGRAVGKCDAGAEREGIGEGGGVVGIGLAQAGLGLELFIQPEQPLVEQRPHHLLHPVGTGDRVEGLVRGVGEGERGGKGDLRLLFGPRFARQAGGPCRHLRPAAGQQEGRGGQETRGFQKSFLHGRAPSGGIRGR